MICSEKHFAGRGCPREDATGRGPVAQAGGEGNVPSTAPQRREGLLQASTSWAPLVG